MMKETLQLSRRLRLYASMVLLLIFGFAPRSGAAPDPKVIEAAKKEGQLMWYNTLVQPHAQEVIVGASIDSVFGPVILCGHGGTAVEVTADSAVALPPLNRSLAHELVSRTHVSRLLAGYRDHPPAKVDALYDVLIAVRRCSPTCRCWRNSISIRSM